MINTPIVCVCGNKELELSAQVHDERPGHDDTITLYLHCPKCDRRGTMTFGITVLVPCWMAEAPVKGQVLKL